MRRLLSTHRHVPLDHADEYQLAWTAVERAVTGAGGRAWLFRGAGHEDRFLEFVEWTEPDAEPLADEAVADALAQLDAYAAPMHAEEWEEAT